MAAWHHGTPRKSEECHGAASDHFMTHLAIWEAPESGPESEWGELVTDAEYQDTPARGSR